MAPAPTQCRKVLEPIKLKVMADFVTFSISK